MKLKFIKSYDDKIKKGYMAIVDKILLDKEYFSGVKVRVINITKKPMYFDLFWFVKDNR